MPTGRMLWLKNGNLKKIGPRISITSRDSAISSSQSTRTLPDGWLLSPAYDLNPVPGDIKPRVLTTAINEDDGTASVDLAMEVAEYFQLMHQPLAKSPGRWALDRRTYGSQGRGN